MSRRDGLPLRWALAVLAVNDRRNRLGASLIISEVFAGGLVAWVALGRGRELAARAAAAHVSPAAALTAGGVTVLLACLAVTWPALTVLAPRVLAAARQRRQLAAGRRTR